MSKNVKISNPMKVITGVDTRWSYANVWEPKSINGSTPKYSVSLIIPKPDRQETQLLLQSLFCTDGFLRRLRRASPACPLEQPRLQVYRLALHQPLGAELGRNELHQPDGK